MSENRDNEHQSVTAPRFTTVHDRYQISDSCCGHHDTATSLKKALAIAEAHAKRHAREAGNTVSKIEVYDRMARRDCVDTWEVTVENAQAKAVQS